MISKIVIFAALAVLASGQVITPGPCPKVKVVQNFDVAGYLGQWYQLARYPNVFEKGNCSTALYGPVEDGLVKVHNVEVRDGEESSIDGTAELADPNSTEAKLIVKFFNPDTIADYWVLGTDYKNYSVVWACREQDGVNAQFAWALSRMKPATQDVVQKMKDVFDANNISTEKLEIHDLPECKTQP